MLAQVEPRSSAILAQNEQHPRCCQQRLHSNSSINVVSKAGSGQRGADLVGSEWRHTRRFGLSEDAPGLVET